MSRVRRGNNGASDPRFGGPPSLGPGSLLGVALATEATGIYSQRMRTRLWGLPHLVLLLPGRAPGAWLDYSVRRLVPMSDSPAYIDHRGKREAAI